MKMISYYCSRPNRTTLIENARARTHTHGLDESTQKKERKIETRNGAMMQFVHKTLAKLAIDKNVRCSLRSFVARLSNR